VAAITFIARNAGVLQSRLLVGLLQFVPFVVKAAIAGYTPSEPTLNNPLESVTRIVECWVPAAIIVSDGTCVKMCAAVGHFHLSGEIYHSDRSLRLLPNSHLKKRRSQSSQR